MSFYFKKSFTNVLILCSVTLFKLTNCTAQQLPDSIQFVATQHNYFMFDNKSINVPKQFTVVHIGDSHIQAGYWGNNLLQQLDSTAITTIEPNLLPHRFIKGQLLTPTISIQTFNDYTVKSCAKANYDSAYKQLSYFKSYDSLIGFIVKHPYNTRINFETNDNYSLQQKTFTTSLITVDTLYYTRHDTGAFILWNITQTSPQTNTQYYNLGLNGASYTTTAKYIHLYAPYLNKANVVILSLGANDGYTTTFDSSQFYHNVVKVVNACNAQRNAQIIITNAGHAQYSATNVCSNTKVVNNVLKRIAIEYSLRYWDWYTIMGQNNAFPYWLQCGLARNDYIHLTPQGYKLQASLFNTLFVKLLNQ